MQDLQNLDASEENNDQVTLRDVPDLLDVLGNDCIEGVYQPTGNEDCPGVLQERTIDVTGLPDYPGCTFTVTFKFHECKVGNLKDIAVGDYQIISHDCQKFSDQIANGSFPDFGDDNDLRELFELQMYEAIEDYIIDEEISNPEGNYSCQQGLLFQITHYASSCYRYCYELYEYDDGVAYWNQIKIGGCGTECCEVHSRVCVEDDGSIYKETDYVECISADCVHCQYDPIFWQYEIHPCEVPALDPGVNIFNGDPDPTPTQPPTTDCMYSCKAID